FIGTPPSDPNFKGVLSDLDVGMFLDPKIDPTKKNAGLTLPKRQVFQIKAKRLMEKKLEAYGPDSGFLFDTNLYTTPERFSADEVGPMGVRELELYDDVLAYLAIRVGCGADKARWLDLKQRLLNRARRNENLQRRVRKLVNDAEKRYGEYERLRSDAIAAAEKAGRKIYPGIDDQAVTRHFEDRMLAFINEHSKDLSADDVDGQALRTQYNIVKADYEASLRESYFTFAAQTYIVRWKFKTDEQKQEFLSDPNKLRRVRADQARFILHYLQHPPGTEGEALRFKVQKIAKYEQRALKVLHEANRRLFILSGFSNEEILALFQAMKGQNTPSEAWVIWRTWNWNRNKKRNLERAIPEAEKTAAEKHAIQRARAYLEHIEDKLADIATELPSF
ncbi:MAG: hypothetical protein O7E54_08815, partial [Planctomycetota bacterium]|nr:hypothetical protein [Planctomycetota bacterium]